MHAKTLVPKVTSRCFLNTITAFSLGLFSMGQAHADSTPADDGPKLKEVVVTAEKRPENVQDVPISITALSGAALAQSGAVNTDDIAHLVPGLNISDVGSGFVSYTYIRGGGTNQVDPGADPSVAYYVDEVYITGTAGLQFDLYDIDHVEVLKGPQGTLFGRNAASGAISVITNQPSSTFSAGLDVDAGSYNSYGAHGFVTGPLTSDDRWLYRVSFNARTAGGYTENLATGRNVDDVHQFGGRVQLEYVGDTFKFLLTAEGMRARDGMTPQYVANGNWSTYLNPAAIAALPALEPGVGDYRQYYDTQGYENQNLGAVTGRLEWKTWMGTVTSISAYRSSTYDRLADYDGTIEDGIALLSHEVDQSFSQELRLAGASDNWHWIGGLYYYHSQTVTNWLGTTGSAFSLAGVPWSALGVPISGAFPLTAYETDDGLITTNSEAAFGQTTYDFTSRFSAMVGGRYLGDQKQDRRSVLGIVDEALGLPGYSVDPKASWTSFDPTASLDFKITPDVLTYFSYAQGFKSGGFQTLEPPTAQAAATVFAPEKVKSYELGLKSEWLDHRLLADVALFRSDITDQQILVVYSALESLVNNAGATRDDGVDLSLAARPTEHLTLDAKMTYQHARFLVYTDPATGRSYAGNAQLRSPDFSGSYSAEYDFALAGRGDLALRGEYSYQTKEFFDNANTELPGLYQPAYGLLNARLTYIPAHGNWSISMWGRNLGNTYYFRNVAIGLPSGLAVPGDPRTFGGSFDVKFY
jgi:iron complex outermembrane recepter protein